MSSTSRLDVSPLLLSSPADVTRTVIVSLPHVTPEEEQGLGQLGLLISIHDPNGAAIARTIDDELKTAYYSQLNDNVEVAFENALRQTNERLQSTLQETSSSWLESLSAAVVVIRGQTLLFSSLGSIQAFVMHRGKFVDILGESGSRTETINPLKLFSQTVSGTLQPNDTVCFFTSSILDYLSIERLKATMLTNSPAVTSVSLERLLEPNTDQASFGGLFIRLLPAPVERVVGTSRLPVGPLGGGHAPLSEASMAGLQAMQAQANNILTPSVWLTIRHGLARLGQAGRQLLIRFNILRPTSHRAGAVSGQVSHWSRRDQSMRPRPRRRRQWLYVIEQAMSGLARSVSWVFVSLRKLLRSSRAQGGLRKRIEHLPRQAEATVSQRVLSWQRLTRRQRQLLVASISLLFLFSMTIVIRGQARQRTDDLAAARQFVTDAQAKADAADAAILYGDEDGARALVSEAEKLVTMVPERFAKATAEERAAASAHVDSVKEHLRHVTTITDPSPVAEVPTDRPALYLLLATAERFYVSDSFGTVTGLSRTDDPIVEIAPPAETDGAAIVATAVRTPTIASLLLVNDRLLELETAGDRLTTVGITFENVDKTLTAADAYNNRLYLLDTKNNQILRHDRTTSQFGRGTSWVTDADADLRNGVSLVVDGSIWLLRNDGSVSKFFQGKLQDFSLKPVDPPLTTATKITTEDTVDNLYLLDPAGRRVVVFNKTGRLVQQFTSEKFTDLKDMLILDQGKTAVVLNGQTVYSISLEI